MIEYNKGVHLVGTGLRFDSRKKVALSFISNANIDKFTPPEKIIATPETIKFLEKRIKKPLVLACPYYRPFTLGNLQVELIPSGVMLGSSQMIVNKKDQKLLYSGDINVRELPTTQPAHAIHCDVLVMKCTYGLPQYEFPSFDESIEAIVKFIKETLSSDSTPVLAVEPIGKAQDIIKAVSEHEIVLSLHKSTYAVTKLYEEFGTGFSEYELFSSSNFKGKAIITPPHELKSSEITNIKNKKVAIISECVEQEKEAIKSVYNGDEVICLSNHADYRELMQFVDLVKPEKVYLIEENANEFAGTLRERGYDAISFEKPTQLNLL